jgi:hypothetical protein
MPRIATGTAVPCVKNSTLLDPDHSMSFHPAEGGEELREPMLDLLVTAFRAGFRIRDIELMLEACKISLTNRGFRELI